jgi:hypothetical protein
MELNENTLSKVDTLLEITAREIDRGLANNVQKNRVSSLGQIQKMASPLVKETRRKMLENIAKTRPDTKITYGR